MAHSNSILQQFDISISKPLAVVLAEDNYECLELQYPRLRLVEEGFDVKVASIKKGQVYKSMEGYPVTLDIEFKDVPVNDIKVLIVPGGYSPDKLRQHKDCLELVCKVNQNGGIIGHVCHGGWVPSSAGIMKGKRTTCYKAIIDDMKNSGATYLDERCVTDGNIVSAPSPAELPDFMRCVLNTYREQFKQRGMAGK